MAEKRQESRVYSASGARSQQHVRRGLKVRDLEGFGEKRVGWSAGNGLWGALV